MRIIRNPGKFQRTVGWCETVEPGFELPSEQLPEIFSYRFPNIQRTERKVDADGVLPLQKERYTILPVCSIRIFAERMNTVHKVEWYRAGQQSFVSTYLSGYDQRRGAFFITQNSTNKNE